MSERPNPLIWLQILVNVLLLGQIVRMFVNGL